MLVRLTPVVVGVEGSLVLRVLEPKHQQHFVVTRVTGVAWQLSEGISKTRDVVGPL